MSNYISGSSSKIGACIEASFNAARTTSPYQIRMTSESLQATYNKLDEGVLMASKTQPEQELGSVSVSGDVSTVLNPSFIQWLMKATLGKEYNYGTTAEPVYQQETVIGREGYNTSDSEPTGQEAIQRERTYLLAEPNEDLPSSGIELWRGNQGFYYSGMTVSNMSLEAPSQDFVKANVTFNGTKEQYLGDDPSEEQIVDATFGGSYKCTKAKLRKANAGSDTLAQFFPGGVVDWDSCPAHEVYDVETSTLTVDNGIEETPATYCSGLYANQPGHGQRSVTLACNVPYSNDFEDFRQDYYAKEDPDKLALLLQFATKENYTYYPGTATETASTPSTIPMHQVLVILPYISISEISANAGGSGMIEGSFTGTALSVGNTEPIKVIVRDYDWQAHQE